MKRKEIDQSLVKERRTAAWPAAFLGACLFMAGFSGCAFTNRDNTPLLNQVEEHLWPKDTALRVAVFPLVFPAGMAAVLIDAFVVHPTTVIKDAAKDTGDVLWDNWEWRDHYVTECAALPWRAVLTPLVFTGDFLARAMFDVPRRSAEERRKSPREEEADLEEHRTARTAIDRTEVQRMALKGLAEARSHFMKSHFPETLQAIGTVYRDLKDRESIEALAPEDRMTFITELSMMTLDAVCRSGRYDLMPARPWPDDEKLQGETVEDRLKAMQASEDSLARWTAFLFRVRSRISDDELYERAREVLTDPSAVLRHIALNWAARNFTYAEFRHLEPQLKRIAEKDPDTLNRAFAGQMIAWMK